jgi:23S rRNA (uracil1939-C5)-methyltransferase
MDGCLTIEAMGARGDGVARGQDGAAIHLPRTLPGEIVQATASAGRQTRATIVRASAQRVAPCCPHFDEGCGGCALQHWEIGAQAAWKRGRLIEALVRAGYPDATATETVVTPPASRRRADFAVRRLRDGTVAVGLHVRDDAAILDLTACAVLRPEIVALLPPLRAMLRRLPALLREGAVIVNLLDTGPDLLLRTDAPLDAGGRRLIADFARDAEVPRIAWAGKDGNPETAAQTAPARLALSGVDVAPPPGAFLQPSAEGEAAIVAAVLAGLPAKRRAKPRILDLYAGIGTLTFPLAAAGRVTAVEGDAAAIAALREAAGKASLPVETLRRDLSRQPLLPAELKPFDVVVLDPPFAGAAAQTAQIARSEARLVIYVSCNVAALSRDAAALRQAGFVLRAATPVDQFRWSPHVEAVTVFVR